MPPRADMRFVVAIDGPSAAGKGTIAKTVSDRFGFAYLDTGLLYRAVGARTLFGDDPAKAAEQLDTDALNASNLRSAEVANAASKVAAIPQVRAALFDFQKRFAQRAGGAVLDGRDIGTVVCPDARHKLFVTASMEVRAERRVKELQDRGLRAIYARVFEDMKERDARDIERAVSPLEPAKDANTLDTSDLDADQVFQAALDLIGSPGK